MGTRFLMTRESTVPDAVKKVYLDTPVTGTVVTKAIDGHPQRVIRTPLVEALERSGSGRGALPRARHAWDVPRADRDVHRSSLCCARGSR